MLTTAQTHPHCNQKCQANQPIHMCSHTILSGFRQARLKLSPTNTLSSSASKQTTEEAILLCIIVFAAAAHAVVGRFSDLSIYRFAICDYVRSSDNFTCARVPLASDGAKACGE